MRKATILSNAETFFATYQREHLGKSHDVIEYNAILEELEFLRHHVRDKRQCVDSYMASYELMQIYAE